MKKFIYVFAAIAALFTMSCNSGVKNIKEDLNGEWNLIAVNGQEIRNTEKVPYLGLDLEGMKLSGFMGCNRLLGTIETDSLNPEKISFVNVGSTRMMCPEMSIEQQIADAVGKVKAYELAQNGVNLLDADGIVLITMVKREAAKSIDINKLEGKWTMKVVKDINVSELEKAPYLEFNVAEKKVNGFSGCNLLNGMFVQEEGKVNSLKFDQMGSTMMAGPGMEAETGILKLIGEVVSFDIEGEGDSAVLTLMNADQEKVIALYRK